VPLAIKTPLPQPAKTIRLKKKEQVKRFMETNIRFSAVKQSSSDLSIGGVQGQSGSSGPHGDLSFGSPLCTFYRPPASVEIQQSGTPIQLS